MIQAILAAFPGARVEGVHDATVDRYGLPADAVAEVPLGEPDMPDFAPPMQSRLMQSRPISTTHRRAP